MIITELPGHGYCGVILKVLSYAWKWQDLRDVEPLELFLGTDSRTHQKMGRSNSAGGQGDLTGVNSFRRSTRGNL
tara:strand:- start:19666 stop:19890 length:225 start_codon:yes stop_codon:yes gene_type:complete